MHEWPLGGRLLAGGGRHGVRTDVEKPARRGRAEATCTGNAIACENGEPGSPQTEWDIDGAGDDEHPGLRHRHQRQRRRARSTSRSTPTPRRTRSRSTAPATTTATVPARSPPSRRPPRCRRHQPQCITDVTTELYDCGNWAVSASWNVPVDRRLRRLHRARSVTRRHGDASHITFVVRNDASTSDVVFQTSDTDLAGLQHLRRLGLLPGRRQRPRLQGQLQPAVR